MPYGLDGDIAIGFQNSWDNPVTAVSSLNFIPFVSESVGQNTNQLVSENMRGIFDPGDSYEGTKDASGDVDVEAQPISLGWMLKALMGDPTTTAVGSAFSHQFTPTTTDFDSKSVLPPITYYKFLGDAGSATLFYNMNVSALEFTSANGEFIKYKASLVGGKFQQIADVTASYETGDRWTWDATSASIAATANQDIEELTISISEALESVYVMNNSKWPGKIKRSGAREMSIAGTICFEDQTEYQNFLNATEQNFVITYTGETEVASGYPESLSFDLPTVRYTGLKPELAGPGRQSISFDGAIKYDTSSVTSAIITLVNTQASY